MIKRWPNRRRQRELSALLRVAWPQLDVALHVKDGYLEGCDGEPHTRARRAAVGSGDGRRRGAPRGRSQPPPPGAVGGVRARASPRAGEAALSTPEAVCPRGSERAPLCRPPHSGAGLILSLSPCSVALQLGVLGRFMRTQAGPPRSFRFGCGGARGCASLTLPGGAAGLGPRPRTLPGSSRVAPHRTHLPVPQTAPRAGRQFHHSTTGSKSSGTHPPRRGGNSGVCSEPALPPAAGLSHP